MENAPLNKAHQQERLAEAFLKQKKFDECIECHKLAVKYFEETIPLTDNEKCLESLRLQKEYNQKQIDTVKRKKTYAEMEQYRKSLQKDNISSSDPDNDNLEEGLEATIKRTIEVHDSLIYYLGKRGGSDNDSIKSFCTSENDDKVDKGAAEIIGNKHPKDDAQIIEELKMLSGQLRDSVKGLLLQLDDRNKEIEKLKATIKVLEGEKQKAQQTKNSSLRVVTDSSGGTSPYIVSPCSDISPDIINQLPELAPLEMPNFDLLSQIKSGASSNNNY